jgi:hypothetical protein
MRKRVPKAADINLALNAVNAIPVDEKKASGWRESLQGTPNYRVSGVTNELRWSVDIYANSYYIVLVGSRPAEECRSLRSVMAYLYRMLGVKPKSKK